MPDDFSALYNRFLDTRYHKRALGVVVVQQDSVLSGVSVF
jgi:hypothetical protein